MLRTLYRLLAIVLLILSTPLLFILYLLVKLSSRGPFIFKQKRMGKDKKIFTIYKIRTMVEDAEKQKAKIQNLNEADGPVFKIKNDPRHTKVGKWIARFALDEIPQLINVIKGEMSFVGPRPLPPEEANQVPEKYQLRFSITPGITSLWIIKGAHRLSFKKWMELDLEYIKKQSVWYDCQIAVMTILLIVRSIVLNLKSKDQISNQAQNSKFK